MVIRKTLSSEKIRKARFGVRLVRDKEIRRINKKFLKHDYATDVISFSYGEPDYLGDLVVSVDTARRLSRELGISYKEELARYLVHGTLHLLGYDDKAPKHKAKMFKRQEAILKKCAKEIS